VTDSIEGQRVSDCAMSLGIFNNNNNNNNNNNTLFYEGKLS
jgi:hypothetical protein